MLASQSFAAGGYALATVKVDRTQVAPGGTIQATYTFRSAGPTVHPLTVFVHITPPGIENDFGADFLPELPTTEWPADGFVRLGPHPILIPPAQKPGRYRILVGMYDPEGGDRLALDNPRRDDGTRRYLAGDIEVVPAGAKVEAKPASFKLIPVDEAKVIDMARKAEEAKRARRAAPKIADVLHSDALEVVLDAGDGVPYEYRLRGGEKMLGEARGGKPVVTIFRDKDRGVRTFELAPAKVTATKTRADFAFAPEFDGDPAGSFVLRYALAGPTLTISLEQVKDRPGYQLMNVELPSLATVYESDGGAWLAHPHNGGGWVDVAKAREGSVRWNTSWSYPAPVAMVGTAKTLAVLEVPSYDDMTEVSVTGAKPEYRRAFVGTMKVVREPGGAKTPNLPANQKSICRLSILPSGNWLDGANLIARRMPKIHTHFYDNKLVYKIFCDTPGMKNFVTFKAAGDILRRMSALTDGAPMVAYLVGWQYRGHDTGYPAVAVVNKRLGGYDGLMKVMALGPKYNAVVSFHDNYDDAYKDSPAWNPDFIARDQAGNLMAGGVWAGGQSYIIGEAAYAKGPGLKRVRYTMKRYKIKKTYHIDVMSAAPLRSDWNPAHPASAVDDLRGKWAIVDEFAKLGADVTSEGLSWPFIGKLSYFWNSPNGSGGLFGCDLPLPMVAAIYRQAADWGGLNADGNGAMMALLYNKCFSLDLNPGLVPVGVESYYLIQLPWFKLHALPMRSFTRDGQRMTLGYGKGTQVDLDFAKDSYSVTVGGVEIARDYATFCPIDDRRIAFYSRDAMVLTAALPKGWDAAKIKAFALHDDRAPEPVAVKCDGRTISVSVAAKQPVIVYRDGKPR